MSDKPSFLPKTAERAHRPGPAGGKRAKNREEKIARIVEAGASLFLEHGVRAVTIDQITKAAGIAKGSFYQYFKNRDELLAVLFAPFFAALRAALTAAEAGLHHAKTDADMLAAYEDLAGSLTGAVLEHDQATLVYLRERRLGHPVVQAFVDETTAAAVRLTLVAREAGLIRDDVPPETSANLLLGTIEHLSFMVLSGGDVGDVLSLGANVITILLEGLRPPG